jgi:hypothetical protein
MHENLDHNMKSNFFIFLISLVSFSSYAQSVTDQLALLNPSDKAWVQESCPRSLGPALYSYCIQREVNAINAGVPTTDNLNQADRSWVLESCPRSLGPALYSYCIQREVNAINAGVPTTDNLNQADRSWVLESCPRSLGPALYSSCIQRAVNAIKTL